MKIIKCSIIVFFFAIITASMEAKAAGLDIDFGGLYLNHQVYSTENNNSTVNARNLGGSNFGLTCNMIGNLSLYATRMLSYKGFFNRTRSSDTQIGISYTINRGYGLELTLGAGFAICQAKFTTSSIDNPKENKTIRYTNIGGGTNITLTYMFGDSFGLYVGTLNNLYKPINQKQYTIRDDGVEIETPVNLKYVLTRSNAVIAGIKIRILSRAY